MLHSQPMFPEEHRQACYVAEQNRTDWNQRNARKMICSSFRDSMAYNGRVIEKSCFLELS